MDVLAEGGKMRQLINSWTITIVDVASDVGCEGEDRLSNSACVVLAGRKATLPCCFN